MTSEQEQADALWRHFKFYDFHQENDVDLKQTIGRAISLIVGALREHNIEALDYWQRVKYIIYEKSCDLQSLPK